MEDDRPMYGPYLCLLDAKQLAVITLHSVPPKLLYICAAALKTLLNGRLPPLSGTAVRCHSPQCDLESIQRMCRTAINSFRRGAKDFDTGESVSLSLRSCESTIYTQSSLGQPLETPHLSLQGSRLHLFAGAVVSPSD